MGRRGRKKGVFQDVSGGPSWERTSNSPVGYVHSSRGQKQGQLRERRERLAYDTAKLPPLVDAAPTVVEEVEEDVDGEEGEEGVEAAEGSGGEDAGGDAADGEVEE